MKRILTLTLMLMMATLWAGLAWSIERSKKDQRPVKEEKPRAAETQRREQSPIEVAPRKSERESQRPVASSKEESKREETPPAESAKIKTPPAERKLIEHIDRFVDKNGNGIDDRLEVKEKTPEKPKPKDERSIL